MNFAPSIYEHCARLIDRTPWDVSRDADLLFAGQSAAYRLYGHTQLVVGVDIYNLEAEAYGAQVSHPDGAGIPAIVTPLCAQIAEVCELQPFDPGRAGRIAMVIDVGRRLQAAFPGVDVRIPVSGPFSIAANLIGLDNLLCDVATDPESSIAALGALVEGQARFCQAVRTAGLDIAFFESAAAPPLLSPEHFHCVELPALRDVLQRAATIVGHPVPCVIGGDTLPILDDILETGTQYVICPAETDQAAFMMAMAAHPEVMVRINLAPSITAGGTWDQIRAEVDRVLTLARMRERVCIGTGALPYETPPENVLQIKDYVASVSPA